MDNIFQTWTQFHKKQNEFLKGEHSFAWLKRASESATKWGEKDYPEGENWKYVRFGELPRTRFQWPDRVGENQHVADENFTTIEIKNFSEPSRFKQGDWPVGLEIYSTIDALPILDGMFTGEPVNQNSFQKVGESFTGQGLVVKLTPDYKEDKPLKFIFDLDHFSQKDLYVHFNINIVVEKGAAGRLFYDVQAQSFCGMANLCTHLVLGKESSFSLYSKEWGGPQSHLMYNVQADVAEEAQFNNFDFTFPSLWSRHNVNVNLVEERSSCDLSGAYFNNKKNFCDHHTFIRHGKGYTESKEDYRGLLSDEAQAVFNGKIFIEKKAVKSNSEQINKNLMLSNKAEVDTKPELQIYNDDVKAAHGATVGQLDEEQRFYLQSRGYSSEQASRILAKAFVYDLLKNEEPEVVDFYSDDIESSLRQLKES